MTSLSYVKEAIGTFVFLYSVLVAIKHNNMLILSVGLFTAAVLFGGDYNPAVSFIKVLQDGIISTFFIKVVIQMVVAACVLVSYNHLGA